MVARWLFCGKPNYEKKIDSIRILFEYNASIRINEYYHREKQTESFTSIMHSELGTLEYLLSASHDVPQEFLKKKIKKIVLSLLYIYLLEDITCMYKQRYICLYIINMYTRILTHVHTRIQIYKCQILSCTSMHLL